MPTPQLVQSLRTEPWDGFLYEPDAETVTHGPSAFAGKRILITGAGGSIGSALALRLAALPGERLLLVDSAERGLFSLGQELTEPRIQPAYRLIVGSVCDEVFLRQMMEKHRPHIVFHAAALKHVQLMEANPFAAAETNVLGTQRMMLAAERCQAEQFILISTDKAVDPISVMGATKRLAELIVLARPSTTKMKVLRLCNVLGSTGSVAPLFVQQIAQGQAVTVTHTEATRMFVSLQRTVECLLETAVADYGGLFIAATGAARRIEELARFLVERANAAATAIVHTELRVGDKLHERILSDRESYVTEQLYGYIRQIHSPMIELTPALDAFALAVQRRDLPLLLSAFAMLVPEYTASGLAYASISAAGKGAP